MIKSGATTGNMAMVETDQDFNIWSPLAAIRTNPKIALPGFVFKAMQSRDFRISVELFWSYGTQQNIGMNVIENLVVPLPPFLIQKAIAAYLDKEASRIDALISKKEHQIELLQEKRQAIITKAVTKGLDPSEKMKDSGVEWIGEIPQGWKIRRLKYCVRKPLKYGANQSAELDDPKLPRYIRITDFDDSGVLREETFKSLPEEVAKEFLLEEGDILFARSGATVGKTFQFKSYKGKACFAGYLIKASANDSIINSDFLFFFTKSSSYESWKNSIFIQATIQNIGADKYDSLIVPVPPMKLQEMITAFLVQEISNIDRLQSKIASSISLLQEYRSSLITAAVSGQIDVSKFTNGAKAHAPL